MQGYRIYVIGGEGQVKSCFAFHCSDDEAAENFAEQAVDGHAIELWQSNRKIKRFESKG